MQQQRTPAKLLAKRIEKTNNKITELRQALEDAVHRLQREAREHADAAKCDEDVRRHLTKALSLCRFFTGKDDAMAPRTERVARPLNTLSVHATKLRFLAATPQPPAPGKDATPILHAIQADIAYLLSLPHPHKLAA
jgi:hypothetical protein